MIFLPLKSTQGMKQRENLTRKLSFLSANRARKSRTTLQNKVRLKVLPEQLTLFVNTSVAFKKNASFNSFLLYRPDYCSEIHTLPCTSNEKYR